MAGSMTPASKAKIVQQLTDVLTKWGESICEDDHELGIYWSSNYAYHMALAAATVLDAQTEVFNELDGE